MPKKKENQPDEVVAIRADNPSKIVTIFPNESKTSTDTPHETPQDRAERFSKYSPCPELNAEIDRMGRHWGDAGRFKMMCKMYEVLKIMKVDPIQLGLKDNPGKQGVVEMVLTLGMKKDADWTEIECELRRRASTAPRVESETKTHPGFLLSQIKDLTGIESGTTIKKYRELAGVQHGTGKRDYRWSKTETLKTLRAIVSHSNVDADIKRAKASILVVENER